MESVSVKRPIQDKLVKHRQGSSSAGRRRVAEVSILHNNEDVWRIELSTVLIGMDLETTSRIGLTMYIKGGE